MRTLILIGLVVGGLVVAGVIQIQKGNDTINITVDKHKLHETTDKAVKVGDQMLRQAEAELDSATQTK